MIRPPILVLALCLAGCAVAPTPNVGAFAGRSANNSFETFDRGVHSASALVLPVVLDRQTSGQSCGAHALASVVNYWRGPGAVDGDALFQTSPPADSAGYSLAELIQLAGRQHLLASGVRLSSQDIVRELEAGRPVLVPVRAPAIYLEPRGAPGANTPVVGVVGAVFTSRVGRVSEWTRLGLVDHYLVINGYDHDRFIIVEPVLGYRTISFEKLERYRKPFDDAAIVFSAQRRAVVAR